MKRESFPQLNDVQVKAATMFVTRKSTGLTLEDIARECNVSRRALFKWRQLPAWKKFVEENSLDIARERMDEVLEVLVKQALKGHSKSLELYLKVCGLIGGETVHIENNVEDSRSNSAIEAELNELRQMLSETDENLN